MIEKKIVCDGCGIEGEKGDSGWSKEDITADRGWWTIKASGNLDVPDRSLEISCSDALYHFCPECSKVLVDLLQRSAMRVMG